VPNPRVLIVGSNATRLDVQGGGDVETGQYLNETVVPAMALEAAGYDLVLATPSGAKPILDARSDSAGHFNGDEAAYARGRKFFDEHPAMNQVRSLEAVLAAGLDDFAGLFVPGGHAPVADLMQDAQLGQILRHFHDRQKPTALLCHGPIAIAAAMDQADMFRAALVSRDLERARRVAAGWPYAGYRMTVFSAAEERVVEDDVLHVKLHFDMVEALRAAGGEVSTNPVNFAPFVVEDRELITGQNPRSDHALTVVLLDALNRSRAAA